MHADEARQTGSNKHMRHNRQVTILNLKKTLCAAVCAPACSKADTIVPTTCPSVPPLLQTQAKDITPGKQPMFQLVLRRMLAEKLGRFVD